MVQTENHWIVLPSLVLVWAQKQDDHQQHWTLALAVAETQEKLDIGQMMDQIMEQNQGIPHRKVQEALPNQKDAVGHAHSDTPALPTLLDIR